ncbi:MAG: CBS domain-containing protein [Planctomycetaceae bacterium]|nr:CBS domain-containing protein [Planctomycetales bacterium]MCB9921629.1 CBS domain-containing protein [Planctomycetaceae bacterium]
MRKKPPLVRDCMTHLPIEAERCETVADATRLMRANGVHHLPIMNGSRLTGILSERDILTARVRWGDAADTKPLEEICQHDVRIASPTTPIDEIITDMLAGQIGCIVIVDGGFVVGMFTTTDALRLLADLFSR